MLYLITMSSTSNHFNASMNLSEKKKERIIMSVQEPITINEAKLLLSQADIPMIDDNVNYWFVRTSGGDNFEKFYFGNYIAIGWDEFNDLEMLKDCPHDVLRTRIEEAYPNDAKPGSTASQIIRFVSQMKPGDYVLIPGANCDRIAFGKIISDAYIYELTNEDKMDLLFGEETQIDFRKRRNVEWITSSPLNRSEIDPLLIPIIYSYGTIVDANPYSAFINRSIYDLYYRNGELHSIFNVTKKENIPICEFYDFISNIFDALDEYSEISGFKIDKRELSIKASINSPGPVEIITAAASAFIFLSALSLFLNGAKVKFSYNILNVASGEIKINSPGLLDKIKKLKDSDTNNTVKLKETENKLNATKNALEIKKSKKKK